MNTYKIAICDDDKTQRENLTAQVKEWAKKKEQFIQLTTFESAESFLFQYAEEKDFDMLLLDIEMGQMNGVELAKAVRREDKEVQIIFITGYMDYISDGYDVEALHYLLKPVSTEKLSDVLDRAAQHLKSRDKSILFHLQGEVVRIPLYEIRYMEVRQNYVTIHANEEYTIKKTLRELEQNLDERFYCIGRSYLVNLYEIRKITRTDVYLKDETVLPLSRGPMMD